MTGTIPTKADNPNVPITPDEIIADALRCRDSGASIVHIHARDLSGSPAYKREIYHEIFLRIRGECPDLIVCGSTSGRFYHELSQRSAVLDPGDGYHPDLASLTLGSMNFPSQASVNDPKMIRALASKMNALGVVPELELFDLGMADYAKYLIGIGVLSKPYYANIILGSLGTLNATPHNLTQMVTSLPEDVVWSGGGIGRYQFYVNSMAVAMGGHVRTGLEDSLYYDSAKKVPATNPGLIDRIVKLAHALDRKIASPAEARTILGLPNKAK